LSNASDEELSHESHALNNERREREMITTGCKEGYKRRKKKGRRNGRMKESRREKDKRKRENKNSLSNKKGTKVRKKTE
jgi:hypothetical protein